MLLYLLSFSTKSLGYLFFFCFKPSENYTRQCKNLVESVTNALYLRFVYCKPGFDRSRSILPPFPKIVYLISTSVLKICHEELLCTMFKIFNELIASRSHSFSQVMPSRHQVKNAHNLLVWQRTSAITAKRVQYKHVNIPTELISRNAFAFMNAKNIENKKIKPSEANPAKVQSTVKFRKDKSNRRGRDLPNISAYCGISA